MNWRDFTVERIVELNTNFEKAFAREILISERIRAQVLCGVFVAAIVFVAVLTLLDYDSYRSLLRTPTALYQFVGVFMLGIGYEFLVQYVQGWFLKSGRKLPEITRYGNAALETAIPTAIILIVAENTVPAHALVSPASMGYFLLILLSTLRLDLQLCVFTGFVSAAQYCVLGYILLAQSRGVALDPMLAAPFTYVMKGVLMLMAGGVAGFVALQIKLRVFNTHRIVEERKQLVDLFGQQVSQAIVDEMLKQDLRIASKRMQVCVMFLDIRNFTPFAEHRNPEDIVSYLNMLFGFMIDSVTRHHGIINQFLGDGFMATFGAPVSSGNDCCNAVNAAVEIVARVRELSEAGKIPDTRVGIGIHTGEAVTGNVGSTIRQQYSITGNVVILASRIEQLNKQFESEILVSHEVLTAIGGHDTAESIGPVPVKGHKEPIHIYRLA